jgi:hypothetical protein
MYVYVLIAHAWWRWIVLLSGSLALFSAYRGFTRSIPWQQAAAKYGRAFGIAVDIQFLMGASLYLILSPMTNTAMSVSSGWANGTDVDFFGIYHAAAMTVVFLFVHVAAIVIRRGVTDRARHLRSLIFYGQVLLIALCAIPWWRPLFRL